MGWVTQQGRSCGGSEIGQGDDPCFWIQGLKICKVQQAWGLQNEENHLLCWRIKRLLSVLSLWHLFRPQGRGPLLPHHSQKPYQQRKCSSWRVEFTCCWMSVVVKFLGSSLWSFWSWGNSVLQRFYLLYGLDQILSSQWHLCRQPCFGNSQVCSLVQNSNTFLLDSFKMELGRQGDEVWLQVSIPVLWWVAKGSFLDKGRC